MDGERCEAMYVQTGVCSGWAYNTSMILNANYLASPTALACTPTRGVQYRMTFSYGRRLSYLVKSFESFAPIFP